MEKISSCNQISLGQLIKQELKERHLSQKSFAEAIGVRASHLSEMIKGTRKIPANIIPKISDFLGVTEALLLEFQISAETRKKCEALKSNEEIEADIFLRELDEIVCVKSLCKTLGIRKGTSATKRKEIQHFFGITNIVELKNGFTKLSDCCFRRSAKNGLDTRMIATWVVKAKAKAKKDEPAMPFKKECSESLTKKLAAIFHENKDTKERVHELLNEYGIGFAIQEKEPKASVDGYSFKYKEHPYIVITCRYDRIDNMAFTVFHELGHIFCGHINDDIGLINIEDRTEEELTGDSPKEMEADDFATRNLIPAQLWALAPRVTLNPYVIQKRYTSWAIKNNLNSWIVLGRVSHETGMYRFTSDNSRHIN